MLVSYLGYPSQAKESRQGTPPRLWRIPAGVRGVFFGIKLLPGMAAPGKRSGA